MINVTQTVPKEIIFIIEVIISCLDVLWGSDPQDQVSTGYFRHWGPGLQDQIVIGGDKIFLTNLILSPDAKKW